VQSTHYIEPGFFRLLMAWLGFHIVEALELERSDYTAMEVAEATAASGYPPGF
jgi:hypothetical protein